MLSMALFSFSAIIFQPLVAVEIKNTRPRIVPEFEELILELNIQLSDIEKIFDDARYKAFSKAKKSEACQLVKSSIDELQFQLNVLNFCTTASKGRINQTTTKQYKTKQKNLESKLNQLRKILNSEQP